MCTYSCHATTSLLSPLSRGLILYIRQPLLLVLTATLDFFFGLAHLVKYTHSTCGRTLLEWWLAMPCKRLSRSRSLAQSCTLSFSRYVTNMTTVPFIPFVYMLPHWVPRLSNRTRTTLHTTRTNSVVWAMLSVSRHADLWAKTSTLPLQRLFVAQRVPTPTKFTTQNNNDHRLQHAHIRTHTHTHSHTHSHMYTPTTTLYIARMIYTYT